MARSREPVSTFEQACWWLISNSLATVDFLEHSRSLDDMPIEAVLVTDLFWCSREQLRVELIRCFRQVNQPVPAIRRVVRGVPKWTHR